MTEVLKATSTCCGKNTVGQCICGKSRTLPASPLPPFPSSPTQTLTYIPTPTYSPSLPQPPLTPPNSQPSNLFLRQAIRAALHMRESEPGERALGPAVFVPRASGGTVYVRERRARELGSKFRRRGLCLWCQACGFVYV